MYKRFLQPTNLKFVRLLGTMKVASMLFILLALYSCTKEQTQKSYVGTYKCLYEYDSFSMLSGSNYDTSYTTQIEVGLNGRNLTVLNFEIPADSLEENEIYYCYSAGSDFAYVKFVSDSLYVMIHGGGMGGGYTITYAGKK